MATGATDKPRRGVLERADGTRKAREIFYFTEDTDQRLRVYAAKQRMDLSDVAEQAVKAYLDARGE